MKEQLQNNNANTSNQSGLYIKQYISGIGDSIAIVFALCIALSVGFNKSESVVGIGTIATIVLSCIMGIGSYLAAKKATQSLYTTSPGEEKIIRNNTLQKTIEQLKGLDLGEDFQQMAANAVTADEAAWESYLEQQQQSKEIPARGHSFKSALATFMASITGSAIAMAAWIIVPDSSIAINWSMCFCLPILFVAGYLKSKINGEPLLWGGIRQLLLGGAIVCGGYLIATIFSNLSRAF